MILKGPATWAVRRAPVIKKWLGAAAPAAAEIARRAPVLAVPALRMLALRSVPEAIALGEELLRARDTRALRLEVARLLARAGAIVRPLELLDGLPPSPLQARLRWEAQVLRDPPPAPAPRRGPPPWDGGRRILYHAAQSLPHHSSGYATRTHGLVASLRAAGWDVEVHTRRGYPNDRYDFIGVRDVDPIATIDGVPYRFAPDRAHSQTGLPTEAYVDGAAAMLVERARALRPAVIHSASNHLVGLAGVEAARRLGVPSIYEVRGLWHMTRASDDPAYEGSDHYRLIDRLEARAAAAADHCFVITGAVGDILAAHGVPRDRMTILPNAVDTERFTARPRDTALAEQWGIGARPVIGYIGSFKDYEGLELLLDAASRLRARLGDTFRVLLVGDGSEYQALVARARALDLGPTVVFTGRQPHAEIARFYSLVDVIAFPRRGVTVCEVVSPLKPFEAMAMERTVVVSDVAALTEIVQHERTGLVHKKDDPAALADQLARCLADPAFARDLALRGAAWVREHRSWARVTAQIADVYERLTRRG